MRKQWCGHGTDDWTLFSAAINSCQPTPHPIFPLQRVRHANGYGRGISDVHSFLCLQAVDSQNGRRGVQRAANRS